MKFKVAFSDNRQCNFFPFFPNSFFPYAKVEKNIACVCQALIELPFFFFFLRYTNEMRIKNKATSRNPKPRQPVLLQSYTEHVICVFTKKTHGESIWTSLLYPGYSEISVVGVNQVNNPKSFKPTLFQKMHDSKNVFTE